MAGKQTSPDPPETDEDARQDSDIPDKEDEAQEEAPPTRSEGEDPWEVPCQVCGLLGCRRHT